VGQWSWRGGEDGARLASGIRQLELRNHEPHLFLPAVVIPVAGNNTEFLEEPGSPSTGVPQQPVALVGEVKDRVQHKRQDVQRCQRLTEVLATVTEVVLQVVALGLQRVDVLVFNLPACSPRRGDLSHRFAATISFSAFAFPSAAPMNSGVSAITSLRPAFTIAGLTSMCL